MLRVTHLVGQASDPGLAERLHELDHRGRLETVRLSRSDMARRRQQVRGDQGTELALLLDRDAALDNGAVLLLDADRAVVVALDEPPCLVLRAADAAQALELGYFAGNMHWKVRFDGARLCIALEGPRADYLARLAHLLQGGGIVAEPEAPAQPAHTGHAHALQGGPLAHGHAHVHHLGRAAA
ncbi:Urease accessory protein ureE 1 [Comamonas serinivorans]|uniref:Urease accessory protein UreE n=1 Tax=Comamonas serinivorans TaxID=1082851 RepID=A0A1Y0EJI1_9BURK|nr:urease accessory protein UreE [Comamonas serinivorans]ARU03581.1 Urease accessory protein ureE 1 [Comamonas serinivorans]